MLSPSGPEPPEKGPETPMRIVGDGPICARAGITVEADSKAAPSSLESFIAGISVVIAIVQILK
ncbi:hypothetical protein GCM10022212_00320 [Actimicrobium antarcticum]|uniref:Uncharacterized protein n=1 Tax=Actimicrobium antarcticum TaxID=1051899 RepID=A0ABP7SGJ9_9BURK